MPRIVDHDARRREIAAALWRVVRTQGVDAVSVRVVAAEAGHSPGALRHYFATQDELFGFAMTAMTDQVAGRARTHLEADLEPFDRAVAVLEELLPLDEQRTGEVLVWLAFADRARHDPALAEVRRLSWLGSAHLARFAVAHVCGAAPAVDVGDLLADPDLEQDARRLQVLVDGWSLQGVGYPAVVTPEVLRAELRSELAGIASRHTSRVD